MKRLPKWQKKLTQRERDHIKTWCGGTLAGFKRTRLVQREEEEKGQHPCFDCRAIAMKIGIEG